MRCKLCNRQILTGNDSEHHLVPKSRGGRHSSTITLHEICHKQIHALFNERELAISYNDINSLKDHRDVKRFIKWISKKAPEFNVKIRIRRKNR